MGSGTSFDYAVVKYYPNGDTAWVRRYDGPANGDDRVSAICVDHGGNVYVTGESNGGKTLTDYATVKYRSDGSVAWVKRYNGSGSLDDRPEDVAVDSSGNVYVTGRVNDLLKDVASNKGTTGPDSAGPEPKMVIKRGISSESDFCTVKYYPNGDTAWVMRYEGSSKGNDYPAAIALDALGNVYVTGSSSAAETSADFATIKYVPGAGR
jgi:dienelactone hydrolase